MRVNWAPSSGFERFGTDGLIYAADDVVNKYLPSKNPKSKTVRIGDLVDTLIPLYSEDHTTYHFGCPKSSTHICGNSSIDISNEAQTGICTKCKFSIRDDWNKLKCKERFAESGIPEDTQVEIVKTTDNGFVSQIAYEKNGERVVVDLPIFKNPLNKSIFELWENNKYKVAIFKNTRTEKFIKINKDPTEQKNKYGKVYGFFSLDQYSFRGNSCELFGCEKPEWICVWGTK